jgi:hypothetical protein
VTRHSNIFICSIIKLNIFLDEEGAGSDLASTRRSIPIKEYIGMGSVKER